MKASTAKRICDAWNRISEEDPDISTERLLEMVTQECGLNDNSVVIEGLKRGGLIKEVKE